MSVCLATLLKSSLHNFLFSASAIPNAVEIIFRIWRPLKSNLFPSLSTHFIKSLKLSTRFLSLSCSRKERNIENFCAGLSSANLMARSGSMSVLRASWHLVSLRATYGCGFEQLYRGTAFDLWLKSRCHRSTQEHEVGL